MWVNLEMYILKFGSKLQYSIFAEINTLIEFYKFIFNLDWICLIRSIWWVSIQLLIDNIGDNSLFILVFYWVPFFLERLQVK